MSYIRNAARFSKEAFGLYVGLLTGQSQKREVDQTFAIGRLNSPLTGPIFCQHLFLEAEVDQNSCWLNDWPVKGQPILAAGRVACRPLRTVDEGQYPEEAG